MGITLLPELRSAVGLVDPEVPKSLELLLEALRTPKNATKRALFGVIRSLENLLSKIFVGVAGLFGSVLEGAKTGFQKGAQIAIVSTLLLAAGAAATNLSPTADKILNAKWMKQAGDIVSSFSK